MLVISQEKEKKFYFRKANRLSGSLQFKKVFVQGKKYSNSFFSLYVLFDAKEKKIGLSVNKRVGSAVKRNGLKRRLREIFRLHQWELKPSLQVVVLKKEAACLSWSDLCSRFKELWGKAQLLTL